MSAVRILWRREVRATFGALTGHVMLAVWLAGSGWSFVLAVRNGEGGFLPLAVLWAQVQAVWLPLLCAAATMRSFAAERAAGTLETLLTAPVREREVVFAKYAAALTSVGTGLLLALVGPLLLLPHLAPALADGVSLVPLAAGCLALLLQAALWTAVGILFSLVCRQQVLAAALTLLAAAALPNVLASAGRFWPPLSALSAAGLPPPRLAADMASGFFALAPLVCHVAATACLLFLAIRLLETRHFRTR
jgi:ABC-2 type transport system permease protein